MSIEFFELIPKIRLKDELSLTLGSSTNGIVEFSYEDIVKSAGHSCPTVMGAYLCTSEALNYLYQDEIPTRGNVEIYFKDDIKDGVIGVISNVIMQITGATYQSGFKGLNGNFVRNNLMYFNSDIKSSIVFKIKDNNKCIGINYNPNSILPHKDMSSLMNKVIQNNASDEEKKLFGNLWQDRVKRIFENKNEVIEISKC